VASNLAFCLRIRELMRRVTLVTVATLTALGAVGCSGPELPSAVNTPSVPPLSTPATKTSSVPTNRCVKPAASNTGPSGPLQDNTTKVLQNGQTLENVRVKGLEIRGQRVTVRNVEATGYILITGDDALIDHVSAGGIAISSASGTTVQYANIGNGDGDGIHVTSDGGRLVKNVVLKYNFIHSPRVPDDAHYDGTQVRGVDGLVIYCSRYDPGAYRDTFNAAIYLEDANGGDRNVSIKHNWLYGFGFSLMIDVTRHIRIIGNRVGGDIHWGTCDLAASVKTSSLEIRDNINDETNKPEPLCSHTQSG
jgi:hypothetical protein